MLARKRKPAPDDRDERAFRTASMLCGFDLAAFDAWSAALGPCVARDELLGLRRRALAALLTTGTESAKPYLELMRVWRVLIERDEFLLPLARKGEPFNRGKSKGAAGATTRYLRDRRTPGMSVLELWEQIAEQADTDDSPVYIDENLMIEKGTGKEITFTALQKRLNRRKSQ